MAALNQPREALLQSFLLLQIAPKPW